MHDLPQIRYGDSWEGTLFECLHIYYAHLTFVRSEHPVCHGSLMTTLIYGPSLACLAHFGPLVPAMNVHHAPKCMSWHKGILFS